MKKNSNGEGDPARIGEGGEGEGEGEGEGGRSFEPIDPPPPPPLRTPMRTAAIMHVNLEPKMEVSCNHSGS